MRLKEDVEKMRQILMKYGPQSWGELREKMGWSLSVQKNRIDFMESRGELTTKPGRRLTKTGKREGRRAILYMLKDLKRSEAEHLKYNATKYIENLGNPVVGFNDEDPQKTISAFISPVKNKDREWAQKRVDGIVRGIAYKVFRQLGRGLKPGQKIAVILTVENP